MENNKHVELLVNILESRDRATIRNQVLESVLAFSKEEALSALQALETALTENHRAEVEKKDAEIERLKPLAHKGLPEDCVEGWRFEFKQCPIRQSEGNQCQNCSNYL